MVNKEHLTGIGKQKFDIEEQEEEVLFYMFSSQCVLVTCSRQGQHLHTGISFSLFSSLARKLQRILVIYSRQGQHLHAGLFVFINLVEGELPLTRLVKKQRSWNNRVSSRAVTSL